MSDNVQVTAGSGTAIATDDVGGVQYQRVKICAGADGSASDIALGQGLKAASLPVTLASDQGALAVSDNGGALTVDGTVTLGAGSEAIGKLAANSGVDIGDVDVASIAAGDNNIGNVDLASAIPAGTNVIGAVNLHAAKADWLAPANPAAVTDNSAHDIYAAQGAGVKTYLTEITIVNSHASVGTVVTIQDDTGTPIKLFQCYAAPNGGGVSQTFPIPRPTGANQKLQVICGTTGANVLVSAGAFKGA